MNCPRCAGPMREETLDAQHGRSVTVDVCLPCQSFWFDAHETLQLTPGGTLTLFRMIGEQAGERPVNAAADVVRCPRCQRRLRPTHDRQRATRFTYLRCPNGDGRLTTFVDFLREKDFVRPMTPAQLTALRQHVQRVNCSGCGAPVDIAKDSACAHCGAPLSMLDMQQASALVAQLRAADARERQPVPATLALDLARARRQVDEAWTGPRGMRWFEDDPSHDLVGAGVRAVVRWMTGSGTRD